MDAKETLELAFVSLRFQSEHLFKLLIETFAMKETLGTMGPDVVKSYNASRAKYEAQFAKQTSKHLAQLDEVIKALSVKP